MTNILILQIIVMAAIIVMSVLGNLLVVFSVMCYRTLRQPPNLLLLALAVTDLFVSLLVMPGALLQEAVGEWPLSSSLCISWVFADVFLCTSSILSLTAICIDRYLAISRPLLYVPVRTPRLIWCWILAVNVLAGLVSAPVFPAWNSDSPSSLNVTSDTVTTDQAELKINGSTFAVGELCLVPQSPIYQLYATIVAFYLPLIVIIILNTQIYIIARKIINREKKSPCMSRHLLVVNPASMSAATAGTINTCKLKVVKNNSRKCDKVQAGAEFTSTTIYSDFPDKENVKESAPPSAEVQSSNGKSVSVINACQVLRLSDTSYCIKLGSGMGNKQQTISKQITCSESEEKQENDKLLDGKSHEKLCNQNDLQLDLNNTQMTRKISKKWSAKYKQQLEEKLEMESKQHLNGSQSGLGLRARGFKFFSRRKLNSGVDETVENGVPKSPSGRLTKYFSGSGYARQEWKATITVAIVVLTFLICWLPFFVLALVRPLNPHVHIPDWISAVTLWLGYTNSMLNPIIYGVLHRDFRRTFGEILSCKALKDYCRTLQMKN